MSTVIKVENLSKQYRLGQVGTGTISHDINRWWHKVRGKEDPYLKIGEANDRTVKGDSDYVWALKDINFEVKEGEVLGIIGRNGAGKSTLLKILSRTTAPSTGSVKIKGRVASLLEVGTGFHPELSGRDNIFLNGSILGMTKREIQSKFDEIVDFAGVERYIDTPVKRYSSGMYVRLAFAVAAHLEPEILIVDEVLAVGDAEFQKKALGKMKDVSDNKGRTVLFVSHNISAINNLCSCGIILKNGLIFQNGNIDNIIEGYISMTQNNSESNFKRRGNKKIEFIDFNFFDNNEIYRNEFLMGENINIILKIKFNETISNADIGINIKNNLDDLITHVANFDDGFIISGVKDEIQEYKITLIDMFFSPNNYNMDLAIVSGNDYFDMIENVFSFSFIESQKIKRGKFPSHVKVYTKSKWTLL